MKSSLVYGRVNVNPYSVGVSARSDLSFPAINSSSCFLSISPIFSSANCSLGTDFGNLEAISSAILAAFSRSPGLPVVSSRVSCRRSRAREDTYSTLWRNSSPFRNHSGKPNSCHHSRTSGKPLIRAASAAFVCSGANSPDWKKWPQKAALAFLWASVGFQLLAPCF